MSDQTGIPGPDPPLPTYRLTLRALPGGEAPPARRLAALLKRALRSFHMKALLVEEVKGGESTPVESGEEQS
jgi:hypothetical protein